MLLSLVFVAALLSTSRAQNYGDGYNDGSYRWRGSYSAGVIIAAIAALVLLCACCMVTRRRRRFARTTNPAAKPPLFGSGPPGYALPFWGKSGQNGQQPTGAPAHYHTGGASGPQYGGGFDGGPGGYNVQGPNTSGGGFQNPQPATDASSDPPPPPYGKTGVDNTNEVYSPPPGPPPQAHTTGETSHFVGGFREQH